MREEQPRQTASAYDFRPSAERLAETITFVLRSADEQGYDLAQILAPAIRDLESLSQPLSD